MDLLNVSPVSLFCLISFIKILQLDDGKVSCIPSRRVCVCLYNLSQSFSNREF